MFYSFFQRFIAGNISHLKGNLLFLFVGKHLIYHGYKAVDYSRKITTNISLTKFQHFKDTLRVPAWQVKNVIDSGFLNGPVHSHMPKLVNQYPDITYALVCNGTVLVVFHINIESLKNLGGLFISCSRSLSQCCYGRFGNRIRPFMQFFIS